MTPDSVAPEASRSSLLEPTVSTVAVVGIGFLVWLVRPAIPLIDGDVWWHIRAGQQVVETGRVPSVDTWSVVGAGMEWVSQDWLSNVLLAMGYGLGELGPTVLSLVFALLVVGSLLMLWTGIGLRAPETGWMSRMLWLTAGLTVAGPVVGVRVQVVDLALAVAGLVVMWHYLARRRAGVLLFLPLLAVAWANLHAGWLLLFLLGGAMVVGEAGDRLLRRQLQPVAMTWRELTWLSAALLGAVAAIAVNPNGIALYLYPFETSAIAAHRDFLAEWSPPDLTTLPGQLFAGLVVIGVLPAFAFGWRRMRLADAFILAGLTLMAAMAARFLLVTGPIAAAIIAISLGPVIASSPAGRALGPSLRRMAQPPRSRRAGVTNLTLATVLAVSGLLIAFLRVSPDAQRQAVTEHMPVAAVDWILANEPGDRPFNTYSWGGYLGFRRPDTLVYIDGRSDIYGDAPIRRYADAISLRTEPSVLLEGHSIDHVLFNTVHPFSDWLDASAEWERVYTDPQASVWVKVPEPDD